VYGEFLDVDVDRQQMKGNPKLFVFRIVLNEHILGFLPVEFYLFVAVVSLLLQHL